MTGPFPPGPRDRILRALGAAGLRVAILHGGGTSCDLDLLVDRPDLAAGALATIPGFTLVQAIRYGPEATTYILAHDGAWLPVDVVSAIRYGGILYLRGDDVLAGARPADAPAPVIDFAYYLAKRFIKCDLGPDQIADLRVLFARDEPGCRAAWARLLPAAAVGDWAALPGARGAMIRHGLGTRYRSLAPLASLARLVRRALRPTGLLIVVLGSDGAGKSTLIDGLAEALRPAFWRVRKRHLRPHLLGLGHGGDGGAPHARPARGPFLSSLQAMLWIADYRLGHVLAVFPALVRSTLVLFDRYADDLAVGPSPLPLRRAPVAREGGRPARPQARSHPDPRGRRDRDPGAPAGGRGDRNRPPDRGLRGPRRGAERRGCARFRPPARRRARGGARARRRPPRAADRPPPRARPMIPWSRAFAAGTRVAALPRPAPSAAGSPGRPLAGERPVPSAGPSARLVRLVARIAATADLIPSLPAAGLAASLAGMIGDLRVAAYLPGTPSPATKATLALANPAGAIRAYLKIGATPAA